MPGPNIDQLPKFKQGEAVSAGKLNTVVDAVRQQRAAPGRYMSSAFDVMRRMAFAGEVAATSLRQARVTTEITPASGPAAADWGDGYAELQDAITGELTGEPVAIDNEWIGVGFEVDTQITVDMAYTPHRVKGSTCGPVDWGDES